MVLRVLQRVERRYFIRGSREDGGGRSGMTSHGHSYDVVI